MLKRERDEREGERFERFFVRDVTGAPVGGIDQIDEHEWVNAHVRKDGILTTVPSGPFPTGDAALEAFRQALPRN